MTAVSRLTRNCIIILTHEAELRSTRSNLKFERSLKGYLGGKAPPIILQEIKSLAKESARVSDSVR